MLRTPLTLWIDPARLELFENSIFFWTALLGGTVFVIQTLLHFLVGDTSLESDLSFESDGTSDSAFRWFNLQAISAFLLMFGLLGLALRFDSGLSAGLAFLGAFLGGLVCAFFIVRLARAMGRMRSSGTLPTNAAHKSRGNVHQRIRGSEIGKVQVTVRDRLVTLDACTDEGVVLETGESIEVVEVISDRLVRVRALAR